MLDRRLAIAAAVAVVAGHGCKRSTAPPPSPVVEIAAGGTTTCARLADGSVSCWGASGSGLIDAEAKPSSRSYIPLRAATSYYATAVPTKAPRGAAQIVVGEGHACARLADGTVVCWGGNTKCQLARPADQERHAATPIADLSGVASIAASGNHTCAVLQSGRVRCWGMLDDGRHDASGCVVRDAPVAPHATQVAVGSGHVCALEKDGAVWCWGMNKKGQLGRGQETYQHEPRAAAVVGLSDVREIAAARDTSCARRGDGTVWCWGGNGSGELGVGQYGDRASPSAVTDLRDATRIALGGEHGCAIVADASVRCWGAKHVVGDGTSEPRLVPTAVVGLAGVTQLALGGIVTMSHSCALVKDAGVRCWGSNYFGQLGDDSTTWSSSPVTVVW